MYSLISVAILSFTIINLQYSTVTGYKWVTLKYYDPIPKHAVTLSQGLKTYVGRARYYDEVLPAEVYNSSYAVIQSCSKQIIQRQFEILVAPEACEWKDINSIKDIPENITLVGNDGNGEPIYIGRSVDPTYYRVVSFYLTSERITKWKNNTSTLSALLCPDNNTWDSISSDNIPKNAISGGLSEDDHLIAVARLKKNCDIIPGQVIEILGLAKAVYEGAYIQSAYCQVLVGESIKYRWVSANNGEIPDYAVVGAKSKTGELMYVARLNKTLGYIVYSEAYSKRMSYEILVES